MMDYNAIFEFNAGTILRISTPEGSANYIKTTFRTVREIIVNSHSLSLGDSIDLINVLQCNKISAIEVYEDEEKALIKNTLFKLLFLYEKEYDSVQAQKLISELKNILK